MTNKTSLTNSTAGGLKAYNAQGRAVSVAVPVTPRRHGRKERLEWERQNREAIAAQRGHAKANAEGFLQIFTTGTLVAAAAGEIDLRALAIDALASRGLDPSTGEWVGFPKARELAELAKAAS